MTNWIYKRYELHKYANAIFDSCVKTLNNDDDDDDDDERKSSIQSYDVTSTHWHLIIKNILLPVLARFCDFHKFIFGMIKC